MSEVPHLGDKWMFAAAAILVAGVQLALVRKSLEMGVAVAGTDRAERATDRANFWTIVALYSAVACLSGGVGGFMVVTLLRDHVRPDPLLLVAFAWAVLMIVGERAVWREYEGGDSVFDR